MKVLILDATHGGQILSLKYIDEGNQVTLADVYRIAPGRLISEMESAGVKVVSGAPEGDYDLVTMPCHCPDDFLEKCSYRQRIWFSDSVNHFMNDKRRRVEITGVKGKTSTCYLLAGILDSCGWKIYLSTSKGAGPYKNGEHVIEEQKSIAPPYLLDLPGGDYDVLINEISLGGSGKADAACITNLSEDYGIARNSRKASEAKKSVLCDGINFVRKEEAEIWGSFGKKVTPLLCSAEPAEKPVFGKSLKIRLKYDDKEYYTELGPGYLSLQYLRAAECACSIAEGLGVPRDKIIGALREFRGVPGRGEIYEKDGIKYVKERNPGISHISVDYTLSCLREMDALEDAVLIIDPVSRKVCDKMDKDLISAVAEKYGAELIISKGDGTETPVPGYAKTVIMMTKEGYQ
ncbi:MAG: coenzyme F430 synthase [Candidatus Methanomethylophilaceae archaeon]|nr:coenzyme F430 synthase [Candidatus Methanomethylophilaceae archaeon]